MFSTSLIGQIIWCFLHRWPQCTSILFSYLSFFSMLDGIACFIIHFFEIFYFSAKNISCTFSRFHCGYEIIDSEYSPLRWFLTFPFYHGPLTDHTTNSTDGRFEFYLILGTFFLHQNLKNHLPKYKHFDTREQWIKTIHLWVRKNEGMSSWCNG